ncbi:Pol Polyprotein [Phytophthora megakarya]|uniref:Pol Polyprotein n=1 Tax=Phytophthora megakarya TaxID=4795 RepID=A0A225UNJ3_9STRA|nr:Pol Polyprotein [Phytophthora megakarya]
MKIRQFRSRMPATIRDCCLNQRATIGNYCLPSSRSCIAFFYRLNAAAVKAEIPFQTYLLGEQTFADHASLRTAMNSPHLSQRMTRWLSFFSKRRELHIRRFVKKLKDVQLKTALEGHQF